MKVVVYDIETGPRPDAAEFVRPFNPEAVRCGNLKDPAKLAAKLAEAEAEHAEKALDQAALKGIQAWVTAIQWQVLEDGNPCGPIQVAYRKDLAPNAPASISATDGGPVDLLPFPSERLMLVSWWNALCEFEDAPALVGFNCTDFDLPMLGQRSFVNDVRVPVLFDGSWQTWRQVDLKKVWAFGSRGTTAAGNLDEICRILGGPGKVGKGDEFSRDLAGDADACKQALRYAAHDIVMTRHVWRALRACLPMPGRLFTRDDPWWSWPSPAHEPWPGDNAPEAPEPRDDELPGL